jgi:hypothetical protein
VRGDKACAVVALVIALGCARSKAWHKENMPTDSDQLRRDIAACRAQSDAAGASTGMGSFPTHVRKTVYRDCMIARGYAQGTPTTWSPPVYTQDSGVTTPDSNVPPGDDFQADLRACEELVQADALTDTWVSELRGCMAAKGHRPQLPVE